MGFWSKRKQAKKVSKPQFSLERLEERAMMAVIPLASGQTAVFYDGDGTEVKVKLSGPGQGSIELVGGVLSNAAIDTLTLTGTTGATALKISTRGGNVHGTTINDVAIDNAVGQMDALKHFKGKHVTLTGDFTADGSIDQFHVRSLGNGAEVSVNGDVGRFKAENLASNARLEVAATLHEFVSKLLAAGTTVEANQLDMLKVKQQAVGANFNVGTGGLTQAKLGWVYNSNFASAGTIGDIVVKGDAMGVAFASNIDRGSDGMFGTVDDFVVDSAATGYIGALKFRGHVGGAYPDQMIDVVSSDTIGNVETRYSQQSNIAKWQYAASTSYPLQIIQESATATGYDDSEIWISVYGQQLGGNNGGNYYYLDPTQIRNGIPVLTSTATITGGITTSSPPTLPSFTLHQWKNASNTWGSNLAFPVAPENVQWSGRILISVGAPMQAQVDTGGAVAAPNPASDTDPATGTLYDFLEFNVIGATASAPTPSLDIDISQVDAFGLPMKLQMFKDAAGTQAFNIPFSGTISGNVITVTSDTVSDLVNTYGLGVGQPVVAAGILEPGTVISSYNALSSVNTITLSKPVIGSPSGSQNFTVEMVGPVGVSAYSSSVMGTGPASLYTFIVNKIAEGSEQARPFFESSMPFLTSGPVQIFGATNDSSDIVITTTGVGTLSGTPILQNGDWVTITGVGGNTAANGTHQVTSVVNSGTSTTFTLDGVVGNGNYTSGGTWSLAIRGTITTSTVITSATSTVPAVGDTVTISGVQGNVSANGTFLVSFVEGSSFALGSPISNGTYVSDTGLWWFPGATPKLITDVSYSGTSPFTITTGFTGDLAEDDLILISGINGNPAANGVFQVDSVTATTFTLKNTTGSGTYVSGGQWQKVHTISGASSASSTSPIVITAEDTSQLTAGAVVHIGGVQGNTAANGTYVIKDVTATTFTLESPAGVGTYTSNTGTWNNGGGPIGIAGATNGGEIVIQATSVAQLAENDLIEVVGVTGNEAANNVFRISNIDHANDTFKLDGSLAGGAYVSGGTWKVLTSLPRLMAPKDIVESLTSPKDTSRLNNYFNEVIDDFFVKHAITGTPVGGGDTAGNVEFSLQSSAYIDPATNQAVTLTYTGHVELDSTYNAYALTLSDASGTDTQVYKIYYPFYEWNEPVDYTPKLALGTTTPSWITDKGWSNQSASQMIFACDAFFADNQARIGVDMNATTAVVLGDLENSIAAAFNRGIVLNDASTWSDNSAWFPKGGTYNYWVEYWHLDGIAYNDLAYGFPYDDKFGFSTNLSAKNPGLAQITVNGWDGVTSSSTTTTTTLAVPNPSFVLQNAQVTLTATVTGTSLDGTVTFFVNGLPVNDSNYSNTAPLQQVPLTGNTATITALLPSLPNPAGTPSGGGAYTVTAVYSGDTVNRPSIGYATINVNELGVSLSPSSGAVSATTTISTQIPGSDYNGTINYTISKSDGTNAQTFAPATTSPTASNTATSNAIPSNVVAFNGNANGTTKISGISSMTDLKVGQTVSGLGVSPNTTISAVGVDSITLNNVVPTGSNIAFTTNGLGASLLVTANFVGATSSDPSYAGYAYFTVT